MAIYTVIEKQCKKHLMPNEKVYATIFSEPFSGSDRRFVVTNHRVFEFRKKLLSWEFYYYQLKYIKKLHFFLDEGLFKSKIVLRGDDELCIPSVKKGDAREFLAALEYAVNQNTEMLSQQTKTCPECAETIKLMAKKCKYCGHKFKL